MVESIWILIAILLISEILKILLIHIPTARHVITGYLNIITDSSARNTIYKDPKGIHSFLKCCWEIAASSNDFSICWCKREMLNLVP